MSSTRPPVLRSHRDIIGEVVLKQFGPHGTFMGTVVEYDEKTGFRVQFDDGDTEDVSLQDLTALLPTSHAESTRVTGSKPSAKPNAAGAKPGAPAPKPGAKPSAPTIKKDEASASEAAPPRPAVAPIPRKKMLLEQSQQQSAAAEAKSPRLSEGPRSPRSAGPGAASAAPASAAPASAAPAAAPSDAPPIDEPDLPEGWTIEVKGRNRVFVSPDGMTRFSTIAKVQRWHRQQMALAARFQAPPPPPPKDASPREKRAAAHDGGSPAGSPRADGEAAGSSSTAPDGPLSPTRRAAAAAAAAAVASGGAHSTMSGGGGGGSSGSSSLPPKKKKRPLPRELRNLAMPDKDWNMSMPKIEPFYSTTLGADGAASIQPRLPSGTSPASSPVGAAPGRPAGEDGSARPSGMAVSVEAAALDSTRERGGAGGTPLVSEEDQADDAPQEGVEGGGAGAPPDDAEPSKPSIQE